MSMGTSPRGGCGHACRKEPPVLAQICARNWPDIATRIWSLIGPGSNRGNGEQEASREGSLSWREGSEAGYGVLFVFKTRALV